MKRWVLAALLSLGACATENPLPLAPRVDLQRMYGGWYIVANIPNWFEADLVGLYDEFSPRPDGDIREDFYTFKGDFRGERKHYTVHDWVRKDTNNAHWRVEVLPPLNFAFLVLYVDPQYRYALFGYPSRSLGWIYAREAVIDEVQYQALLDRFAQVGYDRTRFRRVVQLPSQIGQPGFGGNAGEHSSP